jgi:signal peptidase I
MAPATAAPEEGKKQHELGTYRDTVESIGVAIVLAFVLRAFIIEAFVIPTGSMAPRLLGEHWDVVCPACGYAFAYGYSSDRGSPSHKEPSTPGTATCPNCHTPCTAKEYLNGGDRVLVMKYLYDFTDPQPFDVVVFKNPQDNHENYIKRLIGLPGETIEIVHGDVFVAASPDPNFPRSIRRKPPKAQEAMWQVVYDNDYFPDAAVLDRGPCPRWTREEAATSWKLDAEDGRCFVFEGHKDPSGIFLQADRSTYFPNYGYNNPDRDGRWFDSRVDICTDLKLSAVVMPGEGPGGVALKLSSFDVHFEAEFHTDGNVYLSLRSPDLAGGRLTKAVQVAALKAGKGRNVALTHADFRVAAWVDGECVLETTDEEYPRIAAPPHPGRSGPYGWLLKKLENPVPVPEVKIVAWGAPCQLRHVALYRDEYYTVAQLDPIPLGPQGDYAREINQAHDTGKLPPGDIRHRRAETGSRGWGTIGLPIQLARGADRDLDEFFVLGDNSPQSRDCRSWVWAAPTLRLHDDNGGFLYQLGTVPRYNLLGKAMFVYWPSGYRLPLLGLPLVPNVGKMRFIR